MLLYLHVIAASFISLLFLATQLSIFHNHIGVFLFSKTTLLGIVMIMQTDGPSYNENQLGGGLLKLEHGSNALSEECSSLLRPYPPMTGF